MATVTRLSREHIGEICQIESESFPDPWNQRSFLELLDNPLALAFSALEDDGVAGYLIAYHIPPEIEILNIAVKKSCRRRYIATELFSALLDCANAENAERLTLEVRPSNGGAIAFYGKLGFSLDGFRKNYYTHPAEDAALMSLRLR